MIIELLLCWNGVRRHPPPDNEEVTRIVLRIERTQRRQGRPPEL